MFSFIFKFKNDQLHDHSVAVVSSRAVIDVNQTVIADLLPLYHHLILKYSVLD